MTTPVAGTANVSVQKSTTDDKPTIIGLFGLPCSGKSDMLERLKQRLGEEAFDYYESSGVIDFLVQGGLAAFHRMSEQEKSNWRERAIDTIRGRVH
jgi:adenylylsulfate kinase-like enzyme